jgi:threonine synthase
MQNELAANEGIYAEASSVLPLVALYKLRKAGQIGENETVVAILSATGLKDPGASQSYLPKVPLIEPSLRGLERALVDSYGFSIP